MFVIFWSVINLGLAQDFYPNFDYFARKGPEVYLDETFFNSLENYHVNATPANETHYPWIAKVVHSRVHDGPYMCTASCLKKRIFITASRCIFSLKIQQTTIVYQKNIRLSTLAFVLPSNETKQKYDDIGFIVTTITDFKNWKIVELYQWKNRTDNAYEWFKAKPKAEFMVVGYSTPKVPHSIKSPRIQFNLTELKVQIGLDICEKTYSLNKKQKGFKVPCYHFCSADQLLKNNHQLCSKYHGVEGSAIIEVKTKKLFGLSIWGPQFAKYGLPAGFSVVNSANFFADYKCAIALTDPKVTGTTDLQKFCK